MQRLLQFTLDLFESAPEAKRPPKNVEKINFGESNQPPDQQKRVQATPDNVAEDAAIPILTLQQVLAPATFAHPRASRQTLLDGIAVAYEFKRGKRRTIGFSVSAEGLRVSAPKWVPLYEIDKAVLEKSGWIIRKLQETRERHQRLESARIEWKDGTTLTFLGEQVIVVLDPRHAFGGVGAALKSSLETLPGVAHLTLHVGLPHTATPDQIKDAVQA